MMTTHVKSVLCALALLTAGAAPAIAQDLIAVDSFSNGPLANLGGSNGGVGWAGPWQFAAGNVTTAISGSGLVYPGLETSPGAAVTASSDEVFPMSRYSRSFGALPAGTTKLYISFLLRDDGVFGWGGLLFGTYPYSVECGAPLGMGVYGLMLTSVGLGDVSNVPVTQGDTALLVVKISKNTPAAGLTYSLYLDPGMGAPEPSFPLAQFSVAQVSTLPTGLSIDNGGAFTTDEIRVGKTWASVLPAEPVCIADLNHDEVVDGVDLGMLLSRWGTAGADLTGDGTVNGADLAQLLIDWGGCF